eukprot:gb/GECH01009352.1/.p1 GENE.gb/GECH01009352.1/~~gb/GECH01009352.1/.p1  ORF type:complete len:149 (+),score=6.72 gb/GECH01009352.1/:1-447(+)
MGKTERNGKKGLIQRKVQFHWSGDLLALHKLLNGHSYGFTEEDLFCPFCCCPFEQRAKFNDVRWQRRTLEVQGLQVTICLDSLHAIESITRKLLYFASNGGDTNRIQQIETATRKIPGFSNFVFPEIKKKLVKVAHFKSVGYQGKTVA